MPAPDRRVAKRDPLDSRFFFIHMMKTGGTTFWSHVRRNFATEAVYPNPKLDRGGPFGAYMNPTYLLALPEERHRRIRCYTGHFSFVISELLGADLCTITVLRDPVERTISFLKHWRRLAPERRDRTLEELYEHPIHHGMFIRNHQTRMFAATAAERELSFVELPDIDDARFDLAKENLSRVDLVGLHDRYEEFLVELESRYAWRFMTVARMRVGAPEEVSSSFRQRIARDNAADVEFVRYARSLCEQRQRPLRDRGRADEQRSTQEAATRRSSTSFRANS